MATNNFTQSGKITLPAAVAASGGTVVLAYPTGSVQGDFTGANAGASADNLVLINDNDRYSGSQVGFTYGASTITITNNSTVTWPAGASLRAQYPKPTLGAITGSKGAAITPLTDSTGGTPGTTLAAVTAGGSYAQADIVALKNAVASLAATQATMIAEMKTAGITA